MKQHLTRPVNEAGFTLIEIVVTIMVASVLGTLMFQFMGTAMINASRPVEVVRDLAAMDAHLEETISDYVRRLNSNPATALQLMVADTSYGSDVTMTYITFDSSGNEVAAVSPNTTDTLKVTAQSAGHSLTTLLTNSRAQSSDALITY